jgi:hypothetical protein
MIDQYLINAIGGQLAGEFPGAHVGKMHDSAELALPAILIRLEGEAVVGANLYRGTFEAMVISSAEDATTLEHAELCQAVDAYLRQIQVDTDDVILCGIVATTTAPDVDGMQWRTTMRYTVGYAPAG